MAEPQSLYRVSLYSSPMPWPLSFAVHLWFVLEQNDVTERVEVWAPIWVKGASTLVVDALPPYAGFRSSYFYSINNPKRVGPVTLVVQYEGDATSVAGKLYTVVKSADTAYPYRNYYRLWPGPNSNTFIAWVFAQVPETDYRLPWGAFGKGYKLPE